MNYAAQTEEGEGEVGEKDRDKDRDGERGEVQNIQIVCTYMHVLMCSLVYEIMLTQTTTHTHAHTHACINTQVQASTFASVVPLPFRTRRCQVGMCLSMAVCVLCFHGAHIVY